MSKRKTGATKICPICSQEFYRPKCLLYRKFCSKKCGYIGRGQSNTGRTHFKKGIVPWNKNVKGYMSSNETSFKKGHKPWNYGKPNESARGEKHTRWKGGVTPLRTRLFHSHQHATWRRSIFERDNYTCVLCGARSGKDKAVYIEADHFPKPFYKVRDENNIKNFEEALACSELWDINNGRTLCKLCHKNETKKLWE